MMTENQPKAALSITSFCAEYDVPRRSLYRLWELGDGPARCRVSERCVLIRREDAESWLAARMEKLAA